MDSRLCELEDYPAIILISGVDKLLVNAVPTAHTSPEDSHHDMTIGPYRGTGGPGAWGKGATTGNTLHTTPF